MATEKAAADKIPAKKEIRKGPKIVGRLVLGVVAAAAVVGGALWTIDTVAYVGTDDAAVDAKQVKLSSKTLGRLAAVRAEEGVRVEQGAVLAVLDATDLKAQEAQAQASLAYARKNLALAEVNIRKAKDDAERLDRLFASGAATRENRDHASSAYEAARAQYDIAQAQIDTARAQLGVLEAQLLNTEITSPISGTVVKIPLSEGDVVQPGQTIMSISKLDDLWITANIEETKIGKVRPGAKVKIEVDAYPGTEFEGKVESIQSGIVAPAFQIGEFTKTTQRIPVKIRFAADGSTEGLTLLPGMSAVVKIRTPASLPEFLER